MTIQHYRLDAKASGLDRATLRLMKWWDARGHGFLRAFIGTQFTVALLLIVLLVLPLAVGSPADAVGVLLPLAPVVGWLYYRRTHPWPVAQNNPRTRRRGILFGLLLYPLTGWLAMVPILIGSTAVGLVWPWTALAVLPLVAVGWLLARQRKRFLDDPIYP